MGDIEIKDIIKVLYKENPFISQTAIRDGIWYSNRDIPQDRIDNLRLEIWKEIEGSVIKEDEWQDFIDILKNNPNQNIINLVKSNLLQHNFNQDWILKQLNTTFHFSSINLNGFFNDFLNDKNSNNNTNNEDESVTHVIQVEKLEGIKNGDEEKKKKVEKSGDEENKSEEGKNEEGKNEEKELKKGETDKIPEKDPPKSNTWYYGSMALTGLVLAVLLYFVGKDVFFGNKPILFCMANEVVIRKSMDVTTDENKLTALYFGDEVTVLEDNNTEWIKVKYGKFKGYAKKKYFASRNDYLLVDGVFADDFTRNYFDLWRYKVAILHYLLLNNACGNNLSEEIKREIFVGSTSPPSIVSIQALPTANDYEANWVFKNRKNFNQNAPYNDLLFVVKEMNTQRRTLVVCTFGEDEKPNIKIRKDYPYDTPIFSFWSGYNMNTGSEDIFFETYY